MDYVLDFARALTGGAPSRGRGRGRGGGGWTGLRIALLGIMLGLMLPKLLGTPWRQWLPEGVRVEMPSGGRVSWPAGEIALPDVGTFSRLGAGAVAGLGGGATGGEVGGEAVRGRFARCGRGVHGDCVVDGDTFRWRGEKIRIADIDTPETHPPRCAREARAGEAATRRLQALLNAGPVTLADADRPRDRYGRRLAVVERDGASLGQVLVNEGLARPWEGWRRPWC